MQLVGLSVRNLRSIAEAEVESFGAFNVLIGQNNSGKSNVLAAIDHFFRFTALKTLAADSPSLSRDVDFFSRNSALPIEISATLRPARETIQELVEHIGNEFPQVEHALPALLENRLIRIDVQYLQSPQPLAYVRRICSVSKVACCDDDSVLLEVPVKAANEIAQRSSRIAAAEQDRNGLEYLAERIESEDWDRIRQIVSPRSAFLSTRFREQFTPEGWLKLTRMLSSASDSADASSLVETQRFELGSLIDAEASAVLGVPVRAYAGKVSTIPHYIGWLLSQVQSVRILHLADRRRQIGAEEASRVLQLKMSRGGEATLQSIKETVKSLLGVAIDAFASESSSPPRRRLSGPEAELDVDKFLVEVNGSGIREALRLVLDLEFEQPSILLVEEPEVHLHPALEVAMMRHLKNVSAQTQVFLTTHSTNFLDTGDMRNVYMVRKTASTEVRHLDLEAAENELPKELGLRLSSIFMFDRLVFVEGVTDELVLRAFAETLGYNLGQANVGFVVMGSARNFTHYAAKATMSLLSKRAVQSVFVLDRDERSEDSVTKLENQLGEGAKLHVLGRREIENYLLDEEAMSNLINRRLRVTNAKAETLATTADVRVVLGEVADGLRDLSVAKRVAGAVCGVYRAPRHILLEHYGEVGLASAAELAIARLKEEVDGLVASVSSVVSSAEADVESQWAAEKLSIAPGVELLDGVFSKYGLRYRKDRDASDLAALVPRASIPAEVQDIFSSITSK